MNGFSTLLFLLFAQVGITPPPTVQSTERDFGWDIDRATGDLFYIVQLSPTEVGIMEEVNERIAARQRSGLPMQDPKTGRPVIQPEEVFTDMPRELIGRVSRITVRIGDAILPRNPSLRDIPRRFPLYNTDEAVASVLGRGNFADIESEKVVNAQNDRGLPPLTNLPDLARQLEQNSSAPQNQLRAPALPTANGGSSFLNDSRGNGTTPGTSNLPPFNNTADNALSRSGLQDPSRSQAAPLRDPASEPLWNSSTGRLSDSSASRQDPSRANGYDNQNNFGVSQASNETPYGNRQPRYSAADPRNQDPASMPTIPTNNSAASGANQQYASENQQNAQWRSGVNGQLAGGYPPGNGTAQRNPTQQNPNYGVAGTNYQQPQQQPNPASVQNPQAGGAPYPNAQMQQPIYGNYPYGNQPAFPYNQFATSFNPSFPPAAGNSSLRDAAITELKDEFKELADSIKKKDEEDAKRLPSTSPSEPQFRLASNNTPGGVSDGRTTGGSENGQSQNQEPESAFAKTSDAFAKILFLVSLVANCYLVYLIRKLLLRYRSLLTTVRTHAIS
ncbi:MAG: hypothetical protein ACE361_09110 [Aureliella sp.]